MFDSRMYIVFAQGIELGWKKRENINQERQYSRACIKWQFIASYVRGD